MKCKKLQKELVIGLDMQQLYHLGCDWTKEGLLFLNQGADILSKFLDVLTNITKLKAISNVQIPAHSIAMILTKLTGVTTTPCILEVEIDRVISIQDPQLVMMVMVDLED